jgi:acyl dehydratase
VGYGRFADKYEKRGRRWFVFETRWRDETGLIIGKSTLTMAFPKEPGVRSQEPEDASPKSEVRGQNTGATERTEELTPIVRRLTQEKLTAYSEDSANALRGTSIHVQPEAAKKAGFETTVAQGLMSADYISEMTTSLLGKEWFENAKLSVAFLKPVLCGETLTANGRLAEAALEGAVVRRVYEVWCENERGETVTAGTATALTQRRP